MYCILNICEFKFAIAIGNSGTSILDFNYVCLLIAIEVKLQE